jgi:hypothetical protein
MAKKTTRGLVKNLLRTNLKRIQTINEVDDLNDEINLIEHLADSGMFPDMEAEQSSDGLTLRSC